MDHTGSVSPECREESQEDCGVGELPLISILPLLLVDSLPYVILRPATVYGVGDLGGLSELSLINVDHTH